MVKTMKYSADGTQLSIFTKGAKNISATVGPSRIPPASMNGRRRPMREWVLSDQLPISGSVMTSKVLARKNSSPA